MLSRYCIDQSGFKNVVSLRLPYLGASKSMTKHEYFKLWTALVQEQVHTWVIASYFVMVLDGPQIWLIMGYNFMKLNQSVALNDFQEMHVNS